MNFSIFLLILLPLISAITQKKLDNCEAGDEFVEKYIKYKCYEENGVKGAKIIGCSPTNDMTGITLGAWETYDEKWFKYHCVIDGDVASYSVKACLDPVGGLLPVGKSRSFPEGETFTCFFENNKIKLNHETSKGCAVGNQIYGDGASWTEKRQDAITIGSEKKIVGQGTAFFCRKYSNGTFKAEFAACLTSQNTYIRPDSYGTIDGDIIKCDSSQGSCKLRIAQLTETRCLFNGVSYRHDQEWVSSDRKTAYVCQYGQIVKKGCLVGETLIPLHSIRYVNNEAFYCYMETRLLSFGNIRGCKNANNEITEFEKTFRNGDKIEKCGFKFGENGAIVYQWTQVGCAYSKEVISINGIQQIGEKYLHCVLNGTNNYFIKVLTKVEVEQYFTRTGKRWSNVMSGKEGEGATLKREIKTTAAPTLKPTEVTTTHTTKTTKAPLPKCADLIDDCKNLLGYCKSDEDYLEDIKLAIQNSSITFQKRESALSYLDLITTTSLKKDPSDITKSGRKELSEKRCDCQENKQFSRTLVRSLCPKSCQACGEKHVSVSSVLKSATSQKCRKTEFQCN